MIAIVDYGVGNLFSLSSSVRSLLAGNQAEAAVLAVLAAFLKQQLHA